MKSVAASKKARRSNPHRVDAQLAARKKAAAPTFAPAKPLDVLLAAQPEAVQPELAAAPVSLPDATPSLPAADAPAPVPADDRRALAELRRAFRKAGQPDVPEAELYAFLGELRAAGIPVMRRTSSRIARVLRGQLTVADLLADGPEKGAAA